jgi:hypothetical protein
VSSLITEVQLAKFGLYRRRAGLPFTVVVVGIPAGVGDEVKSLAEKRTVRGRAQARGVGLQDALTREVGGKQHKPSGDDAILYGEEGIAVAVKTVDAVENDLRRRLQPASSELINKCQWWLDEEPDRFRDDLEYKPLDAR